MSLKEIVSEAQTVLMSPAEAVASMEAEIAKRLVMVEALNEEIRQLQVSIKEAEDFL